MFDLKQEIQFVKGVGPSRAVLLNKLGIYTLEDLITYYPRQYEDRTNATNIIDCMDGIDTLIEATIVSKMVVSRIRKNLTIYKLLVQDKTANCVITWFNQTYLKDKFKVGETYRFYGKIKRNYSKIEMANPVFDIEGQTKNTGKIVPIYPSTYSLYQNNIRQIIENAIKLIDNNLEETIPSYLLEQYKLQEINKAIKNIHFPESAKDYETAKKRLVFEELLTVQLALLTLKNRYINERTGIQFDKNIHMSDVINELPFSLTKAQLNVLEEIDKDMEHKKPMNRLLQGDVGSGKTIVSIIASYKAVKSGYQVAIMAPTSILATQHLESFTSILSKYGIKCELLVGNITKKKKEELLARLENGDIDVLIGTHALLEENVIFKKLGLVVTDEQHRFGVRQRDTISKKGTNPDVLVMTATPIPRTLALILYGDLDISIIDELPPNRKQIETYAVTKNLEDRVNNFIKKQIDEGRQCYIVCPLVEDSEEINAKSVLELATKYKEETLKNYTVEYVHGKMKAKDKNEIMEQFKNGNIDVLISTTVIEVGVNVPNATIMVIENAERFGLAQLHQLRGRVGRGEHQSYCVLKYTGNTDIIKQRMQVMQQTNDGFIISEKDLELRGTGEFFGTKQHGLPEFKIANLFEDMQMLKSIQSIAVKILNDDPNLEKEENKTLKETIKNKILII